MKDHEGYLPKGWMMHEPYNLHNGTPALAIYTYLYRTTRKNEWQGSLQTLADLVEIPLRTIRRCLHDLEQRGLVEITPSGYSHYSIKALKLSTKDTRNADTYQAKDYKLKQEGQSGTEVGQSGTEVGQIGTPIKYNNKYNINIKESRRSIEEGGDASAAPAAHEIVLDRKLYIARVLSRSLPEYPYAVVYEYAGLVNIPTEVVDDFLTHYASTGWKMNNGGRVENWAAALMNWYKRAKRFAERDRKFTHEGQTPMCKNSLFPAIPASFRPDNRMKFTQGGLSLLCKNGRGLEQMSEQNRAIYEAEQERKRQQREKADRESASAVSWDEYQATKFTKK